METAALWAAPLLLISAVGLLVLSTSTRFSALHQDLRREQEAGNARAHGHLCIRARHLHKALMGLYTSIAILAASGLLGSLAMRWLASALWIPEILAFLGLAVIIFSSIHLIRESRLLMTVIYDDESDPSK
jgi:hypothetical protein